MELGKFFPIYLEYPPPPCVSISVTCDDLLHISKINAGKWQKYRRYYFHCALHSDVPTHYAGNQAQKLIELE